MRNPNYVGPDIIKESFDVLAKAVYSLQGISPIPETNAPIESKLATVYAYFTLEEWKTIAHSIQRDESLNKDERYALLCKLPSAAFDGM